MEKQPWDAVGIVRTPGHRDRFVCTDNLTGWLEGFTHAATQGRGYMVRTGFAFRHWTSSINGRPLDRDAKALSDTVLPWGHRVDYPDGTSEELLLHSGRRVLSLRVTGPAAGRYEVHPVLATPLPLGLSCELVMEVQDRGTVVHLVFWETEAERTASLAEVRAPGVWDREVQRRWISLTKTWMVTGDGDFDRALFWASASARSFVTQEFGPGLWGGLPWFKDNWGRDTFIAVPGALLCGGDFATARAVLENFARYQNSDPADRNRGRIPNRVSSTEILYNTVDGTPWMIRELDEYLRHTGDREFARSLRPLIRRYVDGALASYVDADGLMRHDDADTWMDARIGGQAPWSPRGDRAVEIQALWIEALEVGQRLAEADEDPDEAQYYTRLALQARGAFDRRFVVQGSLVDRVTNRGIADRTLRPNALMLARINEVLPVDEAVLEATTRRLAGALMVPWGVLSLAPDDPNFHPRHENPARWHKDAAYHNGSIWTWNTGFTISALNRFGWQDRAWELTRNLVGQLLDTGCVGALSELVDALPGPGGSPVPSGTFSQAWSSSEFVRNAFQDYLGFHPDLPRGQIRFRPALPLAWTEVRAQLPFGLDGETFQVHVTQTRSTEGLVFQTWSVTGPDDLPALVIEVPSGPGRRNRQTLEPNGPALTFPLAPARTDAPEFVRIERPPAGWPVEQGTNVLHDKIQQR